MNSRLVFICSVLLSGLLPRGINGGGWMVTQGLAAPLAQTPAGTGGPVATSQPTQPEQRELRLADITEKPVSFQSEIDESGEFTWWLPAGASEYVLPISAGVVVDASRSDLIRWLRECSPWSLLDLPVLGLRYSNQTLVVIVPWPHYAELIVQDRIGIRYSFPKGRHQATPCEIVAVRRGADPLEVARAFRAWRLSATNTGAIPRPRSLEKKMADLEKVKRLPGAPHFYLWGPALFSKHDVPRNKWVPFAKALRSAAPESFGGKLVKLLPEDQRRALQELAAAEWPMDYLTGSLAGAIDPKNGSWTPENRGCHFGCNTLCNWHLSPRK
jgi:hypothetical protein